MLRKITIAVFMVGLISIAYAQKRLDFWYEEPMLFGISSGVKPELSDVSKDISLDHSDSKNGDLSVIYSANRDVKYLGFKPAPYLANWKLSKDYKLNIWIKVKSNVKHACEKIVLTDDKGLVATSQSGKMNIDSDWQLVTAPLSKFESENGFDFSSIKTCKLQLDLIKGDKVWLDDIYFNDVKTGTVIGVTDKSVDQRMAEATVSRVKRVEAGFKQAAQITNQPVVAAFAKMMLNEDLETANQILQEDCKKMANEDLWSLLTTPLYCRFYYNFSNRCGKYPGRMTPETEALLLKTLWDRTAVKNDIHWSHQSTWWLDGSENHDLNEKACNLVTSRIFMNEPEYKDRVYPDYGFGGAYHYGHAGYYGPGIDPNTRHGGGRANLSDGKNYTAKDHYEAWLAFMKTYFRGRVERGFFLEYGTYVYSKHTLNMVDLIYQYSGNEQLHNMLNDFLTLYWSDWAQVSISGVRGGPKTRHHHKVYRGDTANIISFYLGGQVNADIWWYWNLINDYHLPKVVWKMALDREGMGCFTYKARGIGEEENVLPRPLGTERTLCVDTDARFLKYTYVTPDYTLGTQMDHPSAIHSHLSCCGRWHGMTFSQSPMSRIVPVELPEVNNMGEKTPYELEMMYRTVQNKHTLIVQQAYRFFAVHPDWYPTNVGCNQPMGVWFGKDWDKRIEKQGWVFVQKGNAYAAVHPVLWDEEYEKEKKKKAEGGRYSNAPDADPTVKLREDCYSWSEDGTIMLLKDKFSPVIIEAGRVADYPKIEEFMNDVLDNPIALYKTVVPGSNILVYTGCGKDAPEIVFNAGVSEIPTIGGESINYSYPMTFDSPYLKSKYKSGKVHIEYDGEELKFDFNK
jgi:hypothetical protein